MTAAQWMTVNPGWTVIGSPATVGVYVGYPGRFSGDTLTAVAFPPGLTMQGVVIGWSGNGAVDYLAGFAMAASQPYTTSSGLFGVSPVFTVNGGDPTREPAEGPASITSSTATPFAGMTLERVPEPSSVLLGVSCLAEFSLRRLRTQGLEVRTRKNVQFPSGTLAGLPRR
jgi:hypothetical protein